MMPPGVRRIRKWAWLLLGLIALSFGMLGIVVPLLPTTPFIILAALAFGKSSKCLQSSLEHSKLFGKIIADWRTNGSIAIEYKAIAIVMMGMAFSTSIALSAPKTILIIQSVVLCAAAIFIFTRPSKADG